MAHKNAAREMLADVDLRAAPAKPETSYYSRGAIKIRQRVGDLLRYGRFRWGRGRIPIGPETRRFLAIVLHHYAHYAERHALGEKFLLEWTDLDAAQRSALMRAQFNDIRFYEADELAGLLGLTMAVRHRLGITTIGATDFPLAAREELQRLKDNAQKCRSRRSKAQPSRPKHNQSRRLAAIVSVLPEDGSSISISEICERLVDTKAFGFRTTSQKSLPRIVRRLVAADDAGDHVVVAASRKGAVVSRRLDRATAAAKSHRPPAAPPSPVDTPTDAIEFERWFFSELDRFTPETAANLPRWYQEDKAVAIRAACKVSTLEKEFMRVARRRHQELTGKA